MPVVRCWEPKKNSGDHSSAYLVPLKFKLILGHKYTLMGKYYGYVSKSLSKSLWTFVIGYMIEHIGNILLIWKLQKTKKIFGVSIDSQICLLVATLGRCVWFTDTKLPTMNIAWAELISAIVLHAIIIGMCYHYKDASLYKDPPVFLRSPVLLSVAFVMSLIMHPGSKSETYFFTQQMFVSFTMFAEALSLLPQIYHMQTQHTVEGLTTSYLFLLGISRFSRTYFWYTMGGSRISKFWYLIAADILNTALIGGFAYKYRLI